MNLLARVVARLEEAGIPFCLIGAAAMATHGVSRSTFDLDLFTVDRSALDEVTWRDRLGNAHHEVRRGDSTDPLAGVVRFELEGEAPIDLVVGRLAWQLEVVEDSPRMRYAGLELPVATVEGLILLKLYAGGPQDAWDVTQLLDVAGEPVRAKLEARLERLPREGREMWKRIIGT